MLDSTAVTGMVIGTSPINEYDRRVVLLTKERGKITAFARGARRQYSAMLAGTQLFAFGTFRVIEGKNAYTLVSAEIMNYFEAIPREPLRACYASYFLEMAGYYGRENNNEVELLKLLYQTLRALTNPHIPNMLIRYIFELKALTINGQAPQVFQCMTCGNKERHAVFSAVKGGLVCSECMKDVRDGMSLDPSTLYSMQYIETSTIEKLYTFNVTEKVLTELGNVMSRMTDIYVGKHFKSLEILETLI